MIILHLKRYFAKPQRLILYLLTILLITIIQFDFITLSTQSNDFVIGVLDESNSAQSQTFIASLKESALMAIITAASDDQTPVLDSTIDALLIIPKDYFLSKQQKIELYYLESNVKVPAIIDILAVPLIPYELKKELNVAAKKYGYPANLDASYYDTQRSLTNTIDVNVTVIDNQHRVLSEYILAQKESTVQMIALGYFIIAILLIIPLASQEATRHLIYDRLSILSTRRLKQFSAMLLAEIIYYVPPVLIITASIYTKFKLPLIHIIMLCIIGLLIVSALHQVFQLVFTSFDAAISQLIVMPFIMASAIISGAFFDSGLLSPSVTQIGKHLPFGIVATTFDALYTNGVLSFTVKFSLIAYTALGILLAILLFRLLFLRKMPYTYNSTSRY